MAWVGPAIGAAGSVLGGIAGGKSSGGSKAPKWLRRNSRELAEMGKEMSQTPYTPYEGERVAPFSQDTLNAFDMIRNNVGTTQPYYASALDTSQRLQNTTINPQQVQASQWAGTDLSPYLNPYTNQVVDASLADLENQRAVQYNGLASQAQAAGAFGGSRFGVAQGQFEADALRNKSLLAAQLRNQGFETAAGLASQDVDRLNQAKYANQQYDYMGQMGTADVQNRNAFLTGILGDSMGAANSMDAENMARIGSAQDAQAQQQLDVNYGNYWDRTRAYPSQQLGWWSSSLAPGTQVAGIGQPGQSGGLLGALGGAQLGAQVGNSVYDWWRGMSQPPASINGLDMELVGLK